MQQATTHQYPGTQTHIVPDKVKQFEVDVIEVDPKDVVRGFLIDEKGKRIANRHVIVWSTHYGHLNGLCQTAEDGRFRLKLTDWTADRLRTALRKKERGESQKWELKVLPPTKLRDKTALDDIAAIKVFPPIKIRSFSPIVVQIVEQAD